MLENDDEKKILAYKNGDTDIFKTLVEKYTGPIFNFTARLIGKDKAPDAVQEIFIKAWKNIGKFDPQKAGFKTWLFTIARNTATDFLRKRKTYSFADIEDSKEEPFYQNIPDEELLPDESLQKLQDAELLNSILSKLNKNYQEILALRYQEDMTFDEIAKVLGKPLNTVKSQHRRAIIELRNNLK